MLGYSTVTVWNMLPLKLACRLLILLASPDSLLCILLRFAPYLLSMFGESEFGRDPARVPSVCVTRPMPMLTSPVLDVTCLVLVPSAMMHAGLILLFRIPLM